ncbi:MAG: DUF262 domain-containing protein [Lachnospiraceae bacterium]|nr:DUF262 domain-containing protein [Lachnospiraceae bacterium]
MKIELKEILIKDLFEGYKDNTDEGVVAYGGKLNVRPPYQREFVYKDAQRNAVIDTIRKEFPLNVMYWVKNSDGTYELLDGQQRTLSICQYLNKEFSINHQYIHNLTQEEKDQILNYKLMIYFCEGTDKEKLSWFETINIAGEKLTPQELRNAIYTGPWLTSAKKYFSKKTCVAHQMASDYLKGSPIRQDYLEAIIGWVADRDKIALEEYMAIHQDDENAEELWNYFKSVIEWVKKVFPTYRKEMKGLPFGILYNKYKDTELDANALEEKIKELMLDEDVDRKAGIYEYVLDHDERHLNIRSFTPKQKREAYERQNGICPKCGGHFELNEMEGDHITPWSQGGPTTSENCQMLCKDCNRRKSDI